MTEVTSWLRLRAANDFNQESDNSKARIVSFPTSCIEKYRHCLWKLGLSTRSKEAYQKSNLNLLSSARVKNGEGSHEGSSKENSEKLVIRTQPNPASCCSPKVGSKFQLLCELIIPLKYKKLNSIQSPTFKFFSKTIPPLNLNCPNSQTWHALKST